ncbi:MAG: hypothetical protein JW850_04625 [Thermoflexales bacterium]|nr:hypothetical protein [Thermoflexales bacterium]
MHRVRQHQCRHWYWLNTTYACGGVATDKGGIIVDACPIYRRWKGRPLEQVMEDLRRRRQLVDVRPLSD